jgi:uncharacterized protein YjiS (DUF1127 family)
MPLATLPTVIAARLALWRERSVGRHILSQLDERALRDIGLSPGDASMEAAKPFWKP